MGNVVEFPGQGGRTRERKPLWRQVLGEVLRGERLGQERILTEVAATAGVSPQYLSEIERGRKEPSSEILGSVADALGLELVDVVGRVAGRLASQVADAQREHDRRERITVETALAFRADATPRHPLDFGSTDAARASLGAGVFLLAA